LTNAQSVKDKLDDLHFLIDNYNPGIVFITESWLNDTVSDAMIAPTNRYYVVRHDRKNKMGGGVCAVINKRFTVDILQTDDNVEMIAFDILFESFTYRCILCYRPPDYNVDAWKYFSSMLSCLERVCNTNNIIAVFGDFNLPYLSWDTLLPTGHYVKFHQAFLDFTTQHGLVQCVTEPTRVNNILDLILVNDPLLINSCTTTAPLGNSDHVTVDFNLVLPVNKSSTDKCDGDIKYCFNFNEADYDGLNAYLSAVDWQNILTSGDINNCMEYFIGVLNEGMNLFIPVKQVFDATCSSNARSSVRKYPLYIRQIFRKKVTAWRLYKHNKTDNLKARYKAAEAKFSSAVDAFNTSKENELINNGNIGAFYSYINNKLVTKSGIGALKDTNGVLVHEDLDKASVLNEFYGNVFTIDNGIIPDFPSKVADGTELNNIDFNFSIVFKHLTQLKAKSSRGPDGLTAMFIKNLAPSLCIPLSILFSTSFNAADLPDIWKMANVTPIFKKGQTCDPSNYRPISLTCVLCKVMESIVKESVMKYLLENKLLTKHQHGFLAKHSTCSQLLECVNDWSISLNTRNSVDIVYIDFHKAFDSVVHSKLLYKLKMYGLSGNLLQWVSNFLSNRFQSVKVGIHNSSFIPVLSGVPQGSVLGPLLFLIYINDIVDLFGPGLTVKLFADDVKIYVDISDVENINLLQEGLFAVSRWAAEWQLTISINKCAVLHLGRNNLLYDYAIDGTTLPNVREIRDLGVMIDSKLCFSSHFALISAKAHQRAGLINRCFKSRDPHLRFRAFIVYVRPLLEYSSPVWSPVYKTDILKLESVQRRFTKRLNGCANLSYAERLKLFNVETLELRRLKQDLITMYKVFHNLLDVDITNFFVFRTHSITRGHNFKLIKPICNNNAMAFSFNCRRVNCWNSLPDYAVNSLSVGAFKHCLDIINFKNYLYI